MKHIATLFLSAAAFAAFAADVQKAALNDLDLDANPQVVTNVTFAGLATTNDVAAAIAAIPAPDYSPTNAELRATIEAVAPAPGDYETVSNRAMNVDGNFLAVDGPFEWRAAKGITLEDGYLVFDNTSTGGGVLFVTHDAVGAYDLYARWDDIITAANAHAEGLNATTGDVAAAATAATNYVDSAIAALPESVTPETVTNIVRELSLGGIWDAELEVWWTPVMVGGSLTYQATTNVNLNAEN